LASTASLLDILGDAWDDEEVKEKPDEDDEQGRLDEEPPEALPVGVEERDAVRL
jgi:hypothetical protein